MNERSDDEIKNEILEVMAAVAGTAAEEEFLKYLRAAKGKALKFLVKRGIESLQREAQAMLRAYWMNNPPPETSAIMNAAAQRKTQERKAQIKLVSGATEH